MRERTNAHDAARTLPRNTRGQAMLSGNIRCGHCGGRLILTSSTADYVKADGTCVKRKRTRYICYNKVRKRCPCSGPTGYTAHILDARVKAYLRELFAAVKCGGISTVTDDTKKQLAEKQAELLELTQQFEESQSQYELFKDRLLDSIQQADPKRQSMLTEVLDGRISAERRWDPASAGGGIIRDRRRTGEARCADHGMGKYLRGLQR